MADYHYLDGVHDLSLPDWGPYSKKYFGISHLADRARGMRFDFTVMPGVYRRQLGIPDVLRPAGYLPWSVAPDLQDYAYRQQLEAKDRIYADISFARWEEHLRVVRCRCVNHGVLDSAFAVHFIASLETPPEKTVEPVLPENCVWIDALDHIGLNRVKMRPQDGLVFDALRRGERRESGTVRGGCIGGFGQEDGDVLLLPLPAGLPEKVDVALRCKVAAGERLGIALNGVSRMAAGTGEWEVVEFKQIPTAAGVVEIRSAGGAELAVDGVSAGKGAAEVSFIPARENVTPEIQPGPVPNSRMIGYEACKQVYGVWWSFDSDFVVHYRSERMNDLLLYDDCIHQPFFGGSRLGNGRGQDWVDLVMQPLTAAPDGWSDVYAVVCDGSREEVEAFLRRAAAECDKLPELVAMSQRRYWSPEPVEMGRKFCFSQERLASVTLTNVVYPTYFKGRNVRHHTPGRRWNSLYTWDSGFIGLGLLELGKRLAVENLNAYLTEPGDDECAFIHHGSPVPVQFYLFSELANRTGDTELIRYFYPKLKQYYEFMAGRSASSTMRGPNRDGLIRSWDYFYNSGGWDDYPPQWFVRENNLRDPAPVIGSAHVIRCARILAAAAREAGFDADTAMYEADIASLSMLLQEYSWDGEAGYFSYVRHDAENRPAGILRHPPTGTNFNMGLDGAAPLLAGICTPAQKAGLWEKLSSEEHCWTPFGLSTVDQAAPYFRLDGYWNGSIWMPYQWFFWKAALDDGQADFAWRIAETALGVYEKECRDSYGCYEQFSVVSGRGTGWHHFSALSDPVLCWFGAYFVPGRLTGGLDTRIRNLKTGDDCWSADIEIDGPAGETSTLVAVIGGGSWRAEFSGKPLPVRDRFPGTVEIDLPRASAGSLRLHRC